MEHTTLCSWCRNEFSAVYHTRKQRFCSDICRVTSWRHARRTTKANLELQVVDAVRRATSEVLDASRAFIAESAKNEHNASQYEPSCPAQALHEYTRLVDAVVALDRAQKAQLAMKIKEKMEEHA